MKRRILLAAFYFTGTALAFSQINSGYEGPKLLNHIKTVCQLTSQQMAKLQPIVEKHAEILQADKQKLPASELKEAYSIENTRFEGQLKGILTAGQMQLYNNNPQ
ncbi:MAG TPA: hypothetical protein VNZ45_03135 [Bacteroidia bacterium]|jgi:hypothetical protein|nr:hypothetical protein [Bacteroidia bacterium]